MPTWEYVVLESLNNHAYDLVTPIIIEIEYPSRVIDASSGTNLRQGTFLLPSDVMIARYHPLEMYGEGHTREEAIHDLAGSMIEYYECLVEAGEEHLGPLPSRHWQRLNRLIQRHS